MRPRLPVAKRLRFRSWRADDLPLAVLLWGDPAVTRLIDRRDQLTDDDVRERLAREMANATELGVQYWPMFLRAPTGEDEHDDAASFVGCAGLQPSPIGPLELGFHLRQAFWGRGLAREAAAAVIDHAFDVLGHDELLAGHHPDNSASATVLGRLGFAFSHDAVFPPTGLEHPWYRLTAAQWRQQSVGRPASRPSRRES